MRPRGCQHTLLLRHQPSRSQVSRGPGWVAGGRGCRGCCLLPSWFFVHLSGTQVEDFQVSASWAEPSIHHQPSWANARAMWSKLPLWLPAKHTSWLPWARPPFLHVRDLQGQLDQAGSSANASCHLLSTHEENSTLRTSRPRPEETAAAPPPRLLCWDQSQCLPPGHGSVHPPRGHRADSGGRGPGPGSPASKGGCQCFSP